MTGAALAVGTITYLQLPSEFLRARGSWDTRLVARLTEEEKAGPS
ncbi:MAG: hypothetical protein AB1331_00815 [Bacillota bacterium]